MRHALSTYRRLLGAQVRSQLQYRAAFVLDVLSTMMFTVTEFGAFALVLNRFGSVGGWSLGEVAFLYGLVEISFAFMDMIFGGFDAPLLGQQVRKGTLDQLLLRPVSLTLQVFGSDFALRRLGRVLTGSAIFVLALTLADISWTPQKLLYLPLVVIGMILFFGGLFIIGGTLTFWLGDGTEAMNVLTYGGSNLIVYPMTIYDEWLRRLFTFVIPAAFLNYYPALYFLGRTDDLGSDPFGLPAFVPFLAPVAGGVVFLGALAFWRYGLKHYQSTGS